jgi:RNA polymerase sigma-70 factor, ECF subfamily
VPSGILVILGSVGPLFPERGLYERLAPTSLTPACGSTRRACFAGVHIPIGTGGGRNVRNRLRICSPRWNSNARGAPSTSPVETSAKDARSGHTVERDLIEAAKRGSQEAFVDLVKLRGDHLFTIAHRILRDVDRAQDALQDALVIAWRDLPTLRDPDRFDAWIHRLLTHVCIAQATRERRRVSNLRQLPLDGPTAPDPLAGIVDRDQLARGFERLTPEERAILVLRHYAGYEPSEIAQVMGLPAGTVRSRLHHAHRAMRAALEAEARAPLAGGRPA